MEKVLDTVGSLHLLSVFSKTARSKDWNTIFSTVRTSTLLPAIAIAFVTLPVIWLVADYARILLLRRKLPPGPFPLPLFGNYFIVPKYKPWETWAEWSKKYDNPMITVWSGHRPYILCHDAWTISDLLEKRAHLYSSRPRMYAMGDMIDATETNQVCLVYGDKWRLHRRLMHTAVGSQAVRDHRSFQGNESKVLTRDLLENPDNFVLAIERYSCSVVSIIGWGRRIDRMNDTVAQVALSIMEGVDLVMPCYHIVEVIPWLLKVPKWIYSIPSKFRAGARMSKGYFIDLSREAADKGDNFAKRLITSQQEHGMDDGEIGTLTSNLIGGGVDTTSGSIISFILAMCVWPEIQRKAQEEIDRVVGKERSPTWEDEPSLPYITACVTEVLRWRTVTILGGIPHAPIKDDEYRGYLIPAGTPVGGNVWAIHRNPREFPAPDSFRPERFLNGLERPYPTKKGHNAFGWGRRVCSGQPLAEQGLFLTIARLLWAFDILPGLDEDGNEVTLDIFKYISCENTRPEPFKARFIPRTEHIARLIRKEAEVAREELRIYDGETKVTMGQRPANYH
ncbi:cytochrome P450 [Xylogone sp. PMI_703]|nr:cytochrome P450 [Xylogone sp. PMI_703]